MQRIIEALVTVVVEVHPRRIVRMILQRSVAGWVLFCRLWEQLVRNAHLDVVRFTGEHRERFVLGLPAESSNGSVISAAVRYALNSELGAHAGRGVMVAQDFDILDGINKTQAEHLCRDPERKIVIRELALKIRLLKHRSRTSGNGRVVGSSHNRKKLMHTAVGRSIGFPLEAHFADWTVLRNE